MGAAAKLEADKYLKDAMLACGAKYLSVESASSAPKITGLKTMPRKRRETRL